jgi:lauroyl/myristoyl acyltransferase
MLRSPRMHLHAFLRRFAVRGVYWRQYLDFALRNVPFYFQPILLTFSTVFFFFFAAPARRSIVRNLAIVLPGSSTLANHFRAFRTLLNFAWTITEASYYKLTKADYDYEIIGSELLEQLAAARGAIVLTAHMGNYDLGAALFARKFNREIRIVRAPEPDRESEQHLRESVRQTGAGAVKIDYNTEGALLSFDLLGAVRRGEIVSIQGDRVMEGVANNEAKLFGHDVRVPSGPFTLALVAQVPIFPLFIVRSGYRQYQIIVREPIIVTRTSARDEDIAGGVAKWCAVLENVIAQHWRQWFAFTPVFQNNGRA